VGVLAYELVVGKPPFEVEDEAQTATLIMYSNDIRFPPQSSQLWADFVRSVLVKDPARRPSASQLMSHQWWVREETGRG
jgi:aurora kinase